MKKKWQTLVLIGLLVCFFQNSHAGQKLRRKSEHKRRTFRDLNKALTKSEREQINIKKKRFIEIKKKIQRPRQPSSVELTADVDFEALFESGPTEPILTDKGNDYSGLNVFKSKVKLEPIEIDFEKETKEAKLAF